jgi:hypothetical protein
LQVIVASLEEIDMWCGLYSALAEWRCLPLIFFVPMKLSGVEKFAIVEVVAVVPLSMLLSVGVIVLGCRMLDVGDW